MIAVKLCERNQECVVLYTTLLIVEPCGVQQMLLCDSEFQARASSFAFLVAAAGAATAADGDSGGTTTYIERTHADKVTIDGRSLFW